uniref:Uncharacterized protein n=1 Tax=Anguilla anguilla TaxID=7936 RepID=A0A0E9QX72_ANGAN
MEGQNNVKSTDHIERMKKPSLPLSSDWMFTLTVRFPSTLTLFNCGATTLAPVSAVIEEWGGADPRLAGGCSLWSIALGSSLSCDRGMERG